MSREIDNIDIKILQELESDGRLSIVDLAQRVNLTNTPCSERVKRLERSGYITGYRATLDLDKMGLSHLTVVQVSLTATGGDNSLDAFNKAVRAIPEVERCLMLAGAFDYLLPVRTSQLLTEPQTALVPQNFNFGEVFDSDPISQSFIVKNVSNSSKSLAVATSPLFGADQIFAKPHCDAHAPPLRANRSGCRFRR